MGLFEWIGEAIGNAFSALAEFIADGFSGVIKFVGSDILGIGGDAMSGSLGAVKDPKSQIHKDVEATAKEVTKPIDEGFLHDLKRLSKKHSEIPIEQIDKEVTDLWDAIRRDSGVATVGAIVSEAATFGQVDGVMTAYQMADRISGASSFASEIQMMRLRTEYLTMYQRYLNQANPMTLPGPGDLVRFGLREVWDATRRPELLAEQAPTAYYVFMQQHGFNFDRAADFWAAHWVLPSVGQLNEMLHRRVIDSATWDRFVKYNDFDPTVRPWLKAISYNPYTRVDARRMWDLRMLNEDELKDNYLDLGYDEEHAEKMTIWTKIYVLATELRARFSKGWITEADIRTALVQAGMPADRVNEYIEKIIKADADERVAKERDLTKTDITRSVKKGLLSVEEGIARLMDLGYDEDEATFIIESTVTEAKSEEIEADRDLSKADIIEGVSLGYFTETQGITMLKKLGYNETEAKYIIDIRVPPKAPVKLAKERDLTKAEIVKGVKKEIITWAQGSTMLQDLGYDVYEADFILAINIEALAGSPESWSQFQELLNKSKKAQRLPIREIPPVIKDTEENIQKYTQELLEAIEAKKPRQEIINIDNKLEPLKRRHRQLVEQYQKGGEK